MKSEQKENPGASAKAVAPKEKPGWADVPIGAVVLEAGCGVEYETGEWRSERPVVNTDKCINCLFCWVFCPDGAVIVENEKFKAIDYYHCKGCGICSNECPAKVITMVEETKFQEANGEASAAVQGNGNIKAKTGGKGE
ncbi:MAG: 4Fe-4S binding protein [Chloroflexi bacterium]|nr:4Fe-4S binding protein [Chloroflexota bacterium]MDA8188706.1 4Fe-4S binding protein [Dehalococcoidales bacterium]